MLAERRVVDERTFLLGLGELYRDAIQPHERGELLGCARRAAAALDEAPADVPVEGYYAEDEELTEYFRLVRALQGVEESDASSVISLPELGRLRDVTSAPVRTVGEQDCHQPEAGRLADSYGHPSHGHRLPPPGANAPLSA